MRILIFSMVMWALQAYSYPEVIVIKNTYNVEAKNKEDLLHSLNKASPIRENGEVFHAHTDTYVSWNYWWDKRNNYCKLNRVETTVKLTYTLPVSSIHINNGKVKKIWGKYYSALIEHENGHGQIAIDAAQEIEKSLINMPSYSNCDLLSKKANSNARRILNEFKPKHQIYDKETSHGKTQGAHLELYL